MGFQEHCACILVCVESWMLLMGCKRRDGGGTSKKAVVTCSEKVSKWK